MNIPTPEDIEVATLIEHVAWCPAHLDIKAAAQLIADHCAPLRQKPSLAQRAFDSSHIDDELYVAVVRILGGNPQSCNAADYKIKDCYVDEYDSSIEVILQADAAPLTRETANQILALGFGQVYESQGERGVQWTATYSGPAAPRENDGERAANHAHVRKLTAEVEALRELAEIGRLAVEMREVWDRYGAQSSAEAKLKKACDAYLAKEGKS